MTNDFCFVVVSYNQSKYVYEHLESIKYQIEQYGKNKKIQLIFSDDASKDDTVWKAEKWINKNRRLFSDVIFIKHKENIGTVRNMADAINHVSALNYKLLACDDLYYKFSVFEVQTSDILLSPTINFTDEGTIEKYLNVDFIRMFRNRNSTKIKSFVKKMLDYTQVIPSPGVFMKEKIWKDKEFLDYIMRYKYIEDILEWHYIFNLYKEPFSIGFTSQPYILYRRSVGISKDIGREKNNPIANEYHSIRKEIKAKQDCLPKYLNPFVYYNYFINHVMMIVWKKYDLEVKKYIESWREYLNDGDIFLEKIRHEAQKAELAIIKEG